MKASGTRLSNSCVLLTRRGCEPAQNTAAPLLEPSLGSQAQDLPRFPLDLTSLAKSDLTQVIHMEYILFAQGIRRRVFFAKTFNALAAAILALQLVGCGGGGGSSSSGGTDGASLSGTSVGDTATSTDGATAGDTTGNMQPNNGAGTLTLQWVAPVTRADGTPLSLADIDGYRIHYGKAKGKYHRHATVADGTAQAITLKNVPPGTYYVVMTTFDVNGLESRESTPVKKKVRGRGKRRG